MPSEVPRAERRALERAVDLVLVEAVPALVHRREQAVEVVLEVARRDPDVLRAARRSRTDGRSGRAATTSSSNPNRRTTSSSNCFCSSSGNVRAGGSGNGSAPATCLHERRLVLLQVVEDRAHLGRLHAALEVVEDGVVGLVVVAVEALDVAAAELEVLAQRRQERLRSRCSAAPRPRPGCASEADARHLGAELGRHLARLLPVAPRDADRGSPRTSRTRAAPRSRRARRAGGRPPATVNFSWRMRPSVASCSARTAAPRGGIIVCWSHAEDRARRGRGR